MYKEIKNKGVTDPLTLGVIITIVIFAAAVLYFMMMDKTAQAPTDQAAMQESEVNASPVPTISDSDEIDVMEEELESIDAGSVDEDIESLEQDASSL